MTTRQPTLKVLRRAFRVAPTLGQGLAVTIGLAVIGTAMQLVVPVAVQQIIDHQILPGDVDLIVVAQAAGVAAAAVVLAGLARWSSLMRLVKAATWGLSELRVAAFRHLQRLSTLHTQTEQRGAMVARVTSDVTTIMDFMEWGGVGMVVGIAQVILAITAMTIYNWRLALLVVGGVAVYGILLWWFQKILGKAHDGVRSRVSDTFAVMSESISGLPVVRAHGAEDVALRRVDDALERQFKAEFNTARLGAALFSSADLFAGMITAAVIAVGVVLGAAEGTSAGTLIAFLFLVNLLIEPVQILVETSDSAQSAAAGLRRILDVLDTEIDMPEPTAPQSLPAGTLDVRFDRVRFRYPTGPDVLADLSLTIAAGRRVAVVGETGSGKTTFAKLCARLLDVTDGAVLVGGVDVRSVPNAELRARVAFVPQEGFLFDGTVFDNVRYGKPDATPEEVANAFTDLGLADWVAGLPDGLETAVGERGGQVSGGERQLVALTRAWITRPDLLILDEATSAVDPALEVSIRQAIERLSAGRTSITIAHRLSTAEASDEILVFDQGRLVQRGTHAELVATDGVYMNMHADWMSAAHA